MDLRHVTLIAPLSPALVADLLSPRDAAVARNVQGIGGVPIADIVRGLLARDLFVEVATNAEGVEERLVFEGERLRLLVGPRRERAFHRARDLFTAERANLKSLLRETSGDVVHAHWTYEYAWAAQSDGRTPLVVTAHDAPLTIMAIQPDWYRAARTAMAYAVRARVSQLTTVSPYLADRWRRQMLYRRPIAVIPNIAPLLPTAPKLQSSVPRLLTVADSSRRKNVETLIRAFREVRRSVPEAVLELVGPGLGPADALGLKYAGEPGILFQGRLERQGIAEALAQAWLVVHPSLEDACPMAVIEAMAAGIPVVGGAHSGGVPWMLDHGFAGFLADVAHPEHLAKAVLGALADEQRRLMIGQAGLARVESTFSVSAVTSGYLNAYTRALAARSVRRAPRGALV